jgi:hypothetical protein
MDEDLVKKITEAFEQHSRTEYESTLSVLEDAIEIRGVPEGIGLQIILLLFIFIVPVGALIEDRSFLMVALALVWLFSFGRIFFEVAKADLYARFDINEKTFEVENINAVVRKIKELVGFRYSWEGVHKWSDFRQVVLREKRLGKLISNKEYRMLFKGASQKEYPIAEFTNSLLAEKVAYCIARMTGTTYMKIRAH